MACLRTALNCTIQTMTTELFSPTHDHWTVQAQPMTTELYSATHDHWVVQSIPSPLNCTVQSVTTERYCPTRDLWLPLPPPLSRLRGLHQFRFPGLLFHVNIELNFQISATQLYAWCWLQTCMQVELCLTTLPQSPMSILPLSGLASTASIPVTRLENPAWSKKG